MRAVAGDDARALVGRLDRRGEAVVGLVRLAEASGRGAVPNRACMPAVKSKLFTPAEKMRILGVGGEAQGPTNTSTQQTAPPGGRGPGARGPQDTTDPGGPGARGVENLGNSCYISAAVQCLSSAQVYNVLCAPGGGLEGFSDALHDPETAFFSANASVDEEGRIPKKFMTMLSIGEGVSSGAGDAGAVGSASSEEKLRVRT